MSRKVQGIGGHNTFLSAIIKSETGGNETSQKCYWMTSPKIAQLFTWCCGIWVLWNTRRFSNGPETFSTNIISFRWGVHFQSGDHEMERKSHSILSSEFFFIHLQLALYSGQDCVEGGRIDTSSCITYQFITGYHTHTHSHLAVISWFHMPACSFEQEKETGNPWWSPCKHLYRQDPELSNHLALCK